VSSPHPGLTRDATSWASPSSKSDVEISLDKLELNFGSEPTSSGVVRWVASADDKDVGRPKAIRLTGEVSVRRRRGCGAAGGAAFGGSTAFGAIPGAILGAVGEG